MTGEGAICSPVFVGGDNRSGTSLLSVILDSHRDLVVGPEIDFLEPPNLGTYVLRCIDLLLADDPRVRSEGVEAEGLLQPGVQFVKQCHRVGIEFLDLAELIADVVRQLGRDPVTFEERCRLIDSIGAYRLAATGAKRWGIKLQREVMRADRYLQVWPQAQFVVIDRDGRDVAASHLHAGRLIEYTTIEQAAQGWADFQCAMSTLTNSGAIFRVRYEDLVATPDRTLRAIANALGLAWDQALMRHHQHAHSLLDNPYRHPSAAAVQQPIHGQAIGRYKNDLSRSQQVTFERKAGRWLQALGYAVDSA